MTTETQPELSDFVVQSPMILEGEFGQAVYREYDKERVSRFGNNKHLKLEDYDWKVAGSTPFDAILVNEIIRKRVKGGARTPLPADLSNPKLLEMVRGRFAYIDSQGLVLRGNKDYSWDNLNNPLIKYLAEHVDMSRVEREPVLITGLSLDPWPEDKEGYGLRTTVPPEGLIEGSTAIYDDRFLGKWDRYVFDEVDELGLPIGLFKPTMYGSEQEGSRRWNTGTARLCRFNTDGPLDLSSSNGDLSESTFYSQLIILGDETSQVEK